MNGEERFSVWAIDYGFPIVSRASNIMRLPNSFQGMNLSNKKILVGGIENIMPAEMRYDTVLGNSVKERLLHWSPAAIQLMQDILQRAFKLNFEQVYESPQKKGHFFGRLMIQRPDGQMVNVVKVLLDMNMGALIDGQFSEELKASETLKQQHWVSADGIMLDSKVTVSPVVVVTKNETGYTDKEFFNDNDGDDDESIDDEVTLPDEIDERFFDDSVSVFKPINLSRSNNETASQDGEDASLNGINVPTSNVLPPKNSSTETKSKDNTEKQNNNTTPKVPRNDNRKIRNDNRNNRRYGGINRTDARHDQHTNNQQHNPNNHRSHQFQNQRAPLQNHRNPHSNHFNQSPHQFNSFPNQFNSPMRYNQGPAGQVNHQPDRQNVGRVGGYVPPHLRSKFQNKHSRNDLLHIPFGDPDFAASIGQPQLPRINEHVAMPNNPLNIPPYQHPVHAFMRPNPGHNSALNFETKQRSQSNDGQNNRLRKYQRRINAFPNSRNQLKKSTEDVKSTEDASSTSADQSNSITELEQKTHQLTINNDPGVDELNFNAQAMSNTTEENVVVKIEPKQENTDE